MELSKSAPLVRSGDGLRGRWCGCDESVASGDFLCCETFEAVHGCHGWARMSHNTKKLRCHLGTDVVVVPPRSPFSGSLQPRES